MIDLSLVDFFPNLITKVISLNFMTNYSTLSEISPSEWLSLNQFVQELKEINSKCISVYYPYGKGTDTIQLLRETSRSELLKKIESKIVKPTVEGLQKDNLPYKGFIFIGLIKVGEEPLVIEYNVRMGDPETEVVLPRLKSDILDLFEGIATNTLSERDIQFYDKSAATVMLVSGGYPKAYQKGKQIFGLNTIVDSLCFHAGTKSDGPSSVTSGGRVIAITSYGKNIEFAIKKSYETIDKISFEGMNYRKDIGFDLIK